MELSATSELDRVNDATELERGTAGAHHPGGDTVGVGDQLGRYRVTRLLGQGGMGRVFEGRDPELDRPVAIKVLFSHRDGNDSRAGELRLRREAKALAVLSHPNVVQVFDVGATDGHVWIAMELVEGPTLAIWIEKRRSLSQLLTVFGDAARGLAAAHAAGLVHRDFKLTNTIIDPTGRARVLDFGLSTAFHSTEDVPVTRGSVDPDPDLFTEGFGHRVGTLLYMSPEQYRGESTDARSDQFAFCVSLYLALHGRYPERVLDQSPRAMSLQLSSRPEVPAAVTRVLERGMASVPDERYSSMDELVAALRHATRPWYGRWPVRGGAVLVTAGLLAWAAWPDAEQSCIGSQARLDEVWNEPRRQSLEHALAMGSERALRTWTRAEERFDELATHWVSTHRQACDAGRDDPDGLDRRMACLDRRLAALDGAVEAIERDSANSDTALAAALGLSSSENCLDPEVLTEEPVPEDPTLAARTELVRRSLARVMGTNDAGAYQSALDQSEPLLAEAESIGYAPLVAEVLFVQAESTNGLVDAQRTRALLERAYDEASSGGHESKALDAAIDLVWVIGVMDHAPDEATLWVRQAEALLERRDRPGPRAELDKNLGLLAYARGEYAAAIEALERSAAAMKASGASARALGSLYNNIAVNQHRLGQFAEASTAYEQAIALYGGAFGETHPVVGQLLANLGAAQRRLGDNEASRQSLERSVEIITQSMGPEALPLYASLVNLGSLDVAEDKPLEGVPKIERALAVLENARGTDDPSLAEPLSALGSALMAAERYEPAAQHFARAARLLADAGGTNPHLLAEVVLGHGANLRELGRTEQARARLREAIELFERSEGDPGQFGEAKENLALTLDDETAARQLMLEALALFLRAEDRGKRAQSVQRWLDAHPEPIAPAEPSRPE